MLMAEQLALGPAKVPKPVAISATIAPASAVQQRDVRYLSFEAEVGWIFEFRLVRK